MAKRWTTEEESVTPDGLAELSDAREEPGYWSRPPLSGLADCLQPKNKWQKQQLAEKGYIPQITY